MYAWFKHKGLKIIISLPILKLSVMCLNNNAGLIKDTSQNIFGKSNVEIGLRTRDIPMNSVSRAKEENVKTWQVSWPDTERRGVKRADNQI